MKCPNPNCNAENDPANQFCDQCGWRLDAHAAAPSAAAALAAQPTAAAAICPKCGAVVLPGEAFCENCGESLSGVAAPASNAASYDAPTVYAPPMPSDAPSTATPTAAQPPESPTSAPPTPKTESQQKPASSDMPTAEQPALPSDGAYQAEKQRLEDEIARQQQIIGQFEQMQAMFGAAAPPAVVQGLAEARDVLARAQAELLALVGGGAPAPPTAEPAVAAPAETTAPTPVAQAPVAPAEAAAPSSEPAAPPISAPVAEMPPPPVNVPEPPAPPVAPPQPAAAPRLVLDDGGKELPLPTDKAEIIVGREDPISGIFPEIDLTPYGGEGGGVSRQHARISRTNGQWTITDLNSTNYTRVDGNKLDPSLPAPIKDGARIQFGRIAATFRE